MLQKLGISFSSYDPVGSKASFPVVNTTKFVVGVNMKAIAESKVNDSPVRCLHFRAFNQKARSTFCRIIKSLIQLKQLFEWIHARGFIYWYNPLLKYSGSYIDSYLCHTGYYAGV